MSYEMKQVGHGLRAGYEPGGNLEIECLWPDESRLMPRGVRVVVQRADVPDLLRAIMGGKDYERTVAPRLLAELGGASVDRPCDRPRATVLPAGATDPLVAALSAAAYDLSHVDEHGPTAADVMRAGRKKRDAEARLSAVLAAARAVDATHGHGGSVIDAAVALAGALRALRAALAAADGAA